MRMHPADEDYSAEGGQTPGGRCWGGVQMKCENSGSCLKHLLEGGAAVADGCEGTEGLTL